MATTEIPPARPSELHDVPVLLVQLQDDLARSRLREAFWVSVVFHLVVLIALMTSPRWGGFARPIPVKTAEELIRGKELTYLDLPHDLQKVEKPHDTNVISDKNRVATSRRPTLDRRALDELRDSARPGAPGPGGPRVPPQPTAPPQQPQVAQSQTGAQNPNSIKPSDDSTQEQARLEPPKRSANPNPFGAAVAPGTAIEQATRAAAVGRTGGYGGAGGDYGMGPGRSAGQIKSNLDILSDTMGVDFGPYLSRVLHDVRMNWYNLIPEVARAPLMKRGKVSIEFAILKDGKVAGMKLITPSGDVSLDRAAWGGITGSNPFPPLPGEFRGSYLALRFHFFYNPDRNEMQ